MSLSALVRDLQGALDMAVKLEHKLKDKKLFDALQAVVKTAKEGLTDATGGALHRLNDTKPSIDTVKELVQGIPDAMSVMNDEDRLPIQSMWERGAGIKYIPILAKEGIKNNVGGRGMRGGLLLDDPGNDGRNLLECLASMHDDEDSITIDTDCIDAIKELRKDDLFLKEDIEDYDLLYSSCHPMSKMRFEYLAQWDPDSLLTHDDEHFPISHFMINEYDDLTSFTMYLQTTLKHHPQDLGVLFCKDSGGETAYEIALEKHGKEATFKVIQECIPTNTSLPILHHAMKEAPQHFNDFCIRYPSAGYLRDENGRSIQQLQLALDMKTFANDGMSFVKMTDHEIAKVDPVTEQHPFLLVANGEAIDFTRIHSLLSKNPSLLERYIEQITRVFKLVEEARPKKRKRDENENSK